MKKNRKEVILKSLESDECTEIFKKYLKRGVSKDKIEQLKNGMSNIPAEWDVIKNESIDERRERKKLLSSKFVELSKLVSDDSDTKHFRVYDEKSIIEYGDVPSKPLLSNWLLDLAENIDSQVISPERKMYERHRKFSKSPKVTDVVQYAVRRVLEIVKKLGVHERAPNQDTAVFVNVIFSLKGKEKMTNNNVAKVKSNVRKSNYQGSKK